MKIGFLPGGLAMALQFLTRIPVPASGNFSLSDQDDATPWYPLVGAVIGGIVATAAWAGGYASPWLASLAAVTAWVWITGALHLDGLADTADGLGASHADPDRFLEVTKDPHTGSFGVIAIVLALAAKLILIAQVASAAVPAVWLPGLILVPAWARWGPLVWRNVVPPLGDGRGKAFAQDQDWRWAVVSGAILAASSLWLAPILLAAALIVPAIALYWRWRLGGMSGDCHGASIEVTEILLLSGLAIWGIH